MPCKSEEVGKQREAAPLRSRMKYTCVGPRDEEEKKTPTSSCAHTKPDLTVNVLSQADTAGAGREEGRLWSRPEQSVTTCVDACVW